MDAQQVHLERCAPSNSTVAPPARIEVVAAELGELRARQEQWFEGVVARHVAQQEQIDVLLARDDDDKRHRLQSDAPARQGRYVRIYKVKVDAVFLSQSRGGKRRVLAEEATCTKDYVHHHTMAISDECPPWGSKAEFSSC
jgi:hypothetical protein